MAGLVYWDADGDRQYVAGKDMLLSGAALTLKRDDAPVASITTDLDGAYRFVDLDPAMYVVQAGAPQGFRLRASEVVLAVQANRAAVINFAADLAPTRTPTPTPTATFTPITPSATPTVTPDLFTVRGAVFMDADGDGLRDPGELGLSDARIEVIIDVNGDGAIDGQDQVAASAISKANGAYALADLPRGAYVLRETNPSGYRSTTPDEVMVPDQAARLFFVMDFGDRPAQNGGRLYLPVMLRGK